MIVAREIDREYTEQFGENTEVRDINTMETDQASEVVKYRQSFVSALKMEKCEQETKSNFSSLAHLFPNFETKFNGKLREKSKSFPVLLRVSKISLFELAFVVFLLVVSAVFGLMFSLTIDSFNPRNNLAIGREGPGLGFRPRPEEVKSTLIEFVHGGAGAWWDEYIYI